MAREFEVGFTIEWWCKPLVGKSEKTTLRVGVPMTVHDDPSELFAHADASSWTHFCPPGYEVAEYDVQYGYGQTEATTGASQANCRRVHAHKVKPKAGSKNKPKKSAEVVDMENYAWTLAKARDAKATLNAAGIDTVYDLAKTDLANLTSVVGIKGGKTLRASAVSAVSSSSIVDPNWIFDEYYLIDPSWFVNPRIRGTKSAHNKIDAAQSKLIKLQKSGIVTVRQLADASPTAVAKLIAVPESDATGLIDAAKLKTVHQGNGRALKIKPDWVLHPVWLVDPGLLPSVRVVRSQPTVKPAGPTVTVTSPPNYGKLPPSTTQPPGAKPSPHGRKIPKIEVNPANARKIPGGSSGRKTAGGSKKNKSGRGSKGTPEGRREGRGSRGESSDR